MCVAMTFGGALFWGTRNATTTISVQSRSFAWHLCTFCSLWLQHFRGQNVISPEFRDFANRGYCVVRASSVRGGFRLTRIES
jgi:hypothetical protein